MSERSFKKNLRIRDTSHKRIYVILETIRKNMIYNTYNAVLRSRSRWGRNSMRLGAGAENINLKNISVCRMLG